MPDYDMSLSGGGELRIRDTGTQVLFMINTHNSSTWWASVSYVWSVPGDTNNSSSFGYDVGEGWKTVRTVTATANGVYSWNIGDTGTIVVGNPGLHSVTITRTTVPEAPTSKVPTSITGTSMVFDIDDNGDGGSAITNRYYQYSTSSSFSGATDLVLPSNGTVTRTGLKPDTTYYFRGRVKNAVGYSNWSTVRSAKTYDYPAAPTSKALTDIEGTSMTFEIDDATDTGGSPITARFYQYSTSSSFAGATDVALPSNGIINRTGLVPNTTYYFRGKTRNIVGDSPWSTVRSAKTLNYPTAPTTKVPTDITHTSMTFDMDDAANGGAAITNRYYQMSTNSAFTGASDIALPSSGTVTRTDLIPGVVYYWRARTKNSVGYSAYGTTRSAKTLPPVWVKVSGEYKKAIPYVKVSGVWRPAVPYLKKDGAWVIAD